jgi:gamma-glutamylcyclotransferase (GGCT)/AIG2-like uncharacterized protein YtfP
LTFSADQPCEKVFVYGSLRRRQKYRYLIEQMIVGSQPATVCGMTMYHFAPPGRRGEFPYITPGEGAVHGDVLAFRDFATALRVLDELEGHPSLYRRRIVEVRYEDGMRDRAFTYVIVPGREQRGRRVPSGDWLEETRRPGASRPGRQSRPQ